MSEMEIVKRYDISTEAVSVYLTEEDIENNIWRLEPDRKRLDISAEEMYELTQQIFSEIEEVGMIRFYTPALDGREVFIGRMATKEEFYSVLLQDIRL